MAPTGIAIAKPATNALATSGGWRGRDRQLAGSSAGRVTSRRGFEKVEPHLRDIEPYLEGSPSPAATDDPRPPLVQDHREMGIGDDRRPAQGPECLELRGLVGIQPTCLEIADERAGAAARGEEIDEQGSAVCLVLDPLDGRGIGSDRLVGPSGRDSDHQAAEAPGAIRSSRLPAWLRYGDPSKSCSGCGSSACSSTLPSRRT